MQTPIPPKGASRGQFVICFGYCPAEGVVMPPDLTRCHRTSYLTDEIHQLREYSSVFILPRNLCAI